MAARGVAKRYAQAVFDLATESGSQDAWLGDLTTLANAGSDEVAGQFLASPNVSAQRKREVIDRLLPGTTKQHARNLAYMLIERNRFEIAPDMLEVYRDLLLAAQGIAIADVTTAVELTPAEREQVGQQLADIIGRKIEMRLHVDPSLIGGLVARVGDQLIDGSVSTQLRAMRAALAR
jgi:F-type H+-transporting ATPase subunit delta